MEPAPAKAKAFESTSQAAPDKDKNEQFWVIRDILVFDGMICLNWFVWLISLNGFLLMFCIFTNIPPIFQNKSNSNL